MYRIDGDLQSGVCSGLIDTHCHLDMEPLYADISGVLFRAAAAGIEQFVVPGVHPEGWERIARLADLHGGVFPAFGIHPMHAAAADDITLAELERYAPGGVAIGEIGLDPAYPVPLERQEQAFRDQLRLAVRHGLPVLVHCRRAFQKTLALLRDENASLVGGIMHAFSGSVEMAGEFIRLGFAISISGIVTRADAVRPAELVRRLPLEHLVLETDAPDLAPQRHLGGPNQPAYLTETLERVAAIKGISVFEAAGSCRETSRRILKRLRGS